MILGLILAAFLCSMAVLATSSWSQWQLCKNAPLDIDKELPLPWAGYGSSAISLSALFGAYSATLLVLGPACFIGVLLGVVIGLLVTSRWISHLSVNGKEFQEILFSMEIFEDAVADRIFWLSLSFAQFGLAISELVLLQEVFRKGLGLSGSHALVATLSVASVCYFYCLLAGYQAVFRTDIMQYIFLIVMCVSLFIFPEVIESGVGSIARTAPTAHKAIRTVPFGSNYIDLPVFVRITLDCLVGISLGMMPILGAPDTWKRILLLQRRVGTGRGSIMLLIAAAIPVALVTPLFFHLAEISSSELFPFHFIFSVNSELVTGIILLGMISAFMSTFDSAQVSGIHLFLKISPLFPIKVDNERQRYHVLLGLAFLVMILLITATSGKLPHPYIVGVFLIGPVGIVVGLLAGSSLGERKILSKWLASAGITSLVIWLWIFRYFLNLPGVGENPATALIPVGVGALFYFVFFIFGRIFSATFNGEEK